MFICGDNRKLRALGWQPFYRLRDGLVQVIVRIYKPACINAACIMCLYQPEANQRHAMLKSSLATPIIFQLAAGQNA